MQARFDHLVVRQVHRVRVLRQGSERLRQGSETIGLADRIRVVIHAQGHAQFQFAGNAPLVPGINAQTIQGDWLAQPSGKSLLVDIRGAVKQALH